MARGGLPAVVHAVIASAAKLKITTSGPQGRKERPSWQKDAFGYYDQLGEIWYSAQFYSRTLSKLILKPMYINDQGDAEDTDNPVAWEVLDRVKDPGGGRAGLQGQYGKLRFLIGEMTLFCTLDPDTGAEVWEILSPFEVEFDGRHWIRKTSPKAEAKKYVDAGSEEYAPTDEASAVGWRLWVKHPLYSGMADSPMRAVLDECDELLILSHAVRAGARSRLQGNGILLIPSEASPAPTAGPGGDENPQKDIFMDDLTGSMTTPIGDEASASAVVPLVVRMHGEAINNVKHISLARPDYMQKQREERRECIERIALGLDLPPEILLGVTDANHWTAWQIDEDAWKAHVQPVADNMASDLTAGYFRPTLQKMGFADADRYVVGYDASEVVRRPDKSGDAIRLFDRMELKGDTLRAEAGFSDEDKPDDAEIQARLDRAAAMGKGAVDLPPKADAPVPKGDSKPGKPSNNAMDNAAKIEATAELMIDRCRQVAGSRIRTRLQKTPEWLSLVRHVHNDRVAWTLAQNLGSLPPQLGAPDQLVAGGGELFANRLLRWGLLPEHAEQMVRAAEEHARDTLLDPEPGDLPVEIQKLVELARMAAVPA